MIKYSASLISYTPTRKHEVTEAFDRFRIDAATLQIERMAYTAIKAVAWLDTAAGRRTMRAASQAFKLYASGTIKISDCYEIEFWSSKS